ncbi:metallo-beta-lactamase superfamily protein [Trichoderma harzianum]|uniref:Metallo-beta-lactamase superfamily protein n=1 Tax=Trichoderma harzianum TaxID=5544 RepID=A0A0F9ZZB2_TRIHA|nr:metallo-beta-lactamase superfamily protein [Trichoderma harzianum]
MSSPQPITQNDSIQAYVYVLPPSKVDFPGQPDTESFEFSPTAFTLITTQDGAVLVDAPTTPSQGEEVAKWVKSIIADKKLAYLYITHGHGDHFFAAEVIQKYYPEARILATPQTYAQMQENLDKKMYEGLWVATTPELRNKSPPEVQVDILKGDNTFVVGGHRFHVLSLPGGDIGESTVLHVPDLELVVAGDVVYGSCYQFLGQAQTTELRNNWLQSIDQVAQLKPKVVVPSHMQSHEGFGADHIEETIKYIKAWEELDAATNTSQELEEAVREKYPNRIGNFILRFSSLVAKGDMPGP